MSDARALDWLLASEQPSVRYWTLRDLLGRPEDHPEVRAARSEILRRGWAAEILSERGPEGSWGDPAQLYRPKYVSTNWRLLVLADLAAPAEDPRIASSLDLWIERFRKSDGGFGIDGAGRSHLCVAGNTARALVQFGRLDHPSVRSALAWLVAHQSKLGGWSCWGSGRNLDSWEGLSALAAVPAARRNAGQREAIERGAEFYLSRELSRQGGRYAPWFRFHYPVHYYYDLLVGLEILTSLGYADDPRLRPAVAHLKRRRRPDGRWNLDAIHPDVEGPIAEWFRTHPKQRPIPGGLEIPGEPSVWITLRALRVLARVEGTR